MKTVHQFRQRPGRLPQPQPVAAACALLLFSVAAHAQQAATPPAAAASAVTVAQAAPAPAAAASAAPVATVAQATAETPQGQATQQIDTVVVTGIRRSLDSSLNLKRNTHGVVDGIVAEDIGKFPDTNLAEAMQRISGVSIDRTATGEGSKVTVRGVGPDFNQVLLNGRQMPASSIQDTAASNSRAFDFANLASESIAALEVYKTSRASTPSGGLGATINIKTARPLDSRETTANIGVKAVYDESGRNLPDHIRGDKVTPEVSGIYSTTFADGMFGVAVSGSYQKRDSGYNQAGVFNGWRPMKGSETGWGTIPQPGQPGSENITNGPGPDDVYSLPQNIGYSLNGIQRERTNMQATFQFAPTRTLTATVDFTGATNKVQTKRNDLSAWFNFGPSSSSWTDGPVKGPLSYTEIISPATSDIAMGAGEFGVKNRNRSTGVNLEWKPTDRFNLAFDAHDSTATSGADSPFGTNAVVGSASFNRGNTTVDFSKDLPVLILDGATRDASRQLVTGSSFRNSYMKSNVKQQQLSGGWKVDDDSRIDFGAGLTKVNNRTAYGFNQLDTWGGATNAGDYPDDVWMPATLNQYFDRIPGHNDPRLFNQFYVFDFRKVRDIAASVWSDPSKYLPPTTFSTDRRTIEKSQSAYLQYTRDWELLVPMSATVGMRYEKTKVTSSALVPTATGLTWGSNNELTVLRGDPGFTTLKGDYNYWLPSIDWDADLTDRIKLRASYGTTIGRPSWDAIQGGQTLDELARLGGGTGAQGNPSLKPLKSKNIDFSLEFYYARSSYVAAGFFRKNISNYIGNSIIQATPFNLHTPIGGRLYNEAVGTGCATDLTCIRNYILNTYNGTNGVVRTGVDDNGNAQGTIAGQPDDPIANFNITVPINSRSQNLSGWELNLQHMFGASGFGVSANYTYVKSGLKYNNADLADQYALNGLSDSANLVGFYENDRFSVRAAYNWRDKFLMSGNDGNTLGRSAPMYTEAYGQWDLSAGWKFSDRLTVQAEVINLTDEYQRIHGRTKEQVNSVTQTGRRYMLGMRYKF